MACRTGCPTQNHGSWGECARSANIRTIWVQHTKGLEKSKDDHHERELQRYRDARRQGIQPASTKTKDIIEAEQISQSFGRAFDAAEPTGVLVG